MYVKTRVRSVTRPLNTAIHHVAKIQITPVDILPSADVIATCSFGHAKQFLFVCA